MAKSCEQSQLQPSTVRDNIDHPVIQGQIAKHMRTICDKSEVDGVYLLKNLADLLEADITEGMDINGRWLPLTQWSSRLRKKIESYEADPVTGVPTKVKFATTLNIIAMIGKHTSVGAFEERSRHIHDVSVAVGERVDNARKRVTGMLIEGETS